MDPSYVQVSGWGPTHQVVHMDYAGYAGAHPPPFTSPPATPMTPMTPVTPHHAFPMPQYDIPNHYNSHPPPPPQYTPPPDYRLYALCQYLSQHAALKDRDVKFWWEEFMTEFFHEGATLVVEVDLGEGTRKFRLSRQWIPFYFKSFVENGVTALHLELGEGSSTYHQGLLEMEFRKAVMETHHSTPQSTKVCTSGSLIVDFTLEDKPRIISWYFHINDHMEFVPRQTTSTEESGVLGNITCRGLLPATQKLLFEAGLLDYHDNPQTSSAVNSTGPVTSGSGQWHQPPVPQLIAIPSGEQFQCEGLQHHQTPPLTNGHAQTGPSADAKIKISQPCSKGHMTPPTLHVGTSSPATSMMVATEAVLLGDNVDVLSLCVGGEERKIMKVHSQRQVNSPHSNRMEVPATANYHANYNHSNGNVGGGAWDIHIKQEQISH